MGPDWAYLCFVLGQDLISLRYGSAQLHALHVAFIMLFNIYIYSILLKWFSQSQTGNATLAVSYFLSLYLISETDSEPVFKSEFVSYRWRLYLVALACTYFLIFHIVFEPVSCFLSLLFVLKPVPYSLSLHIISKLSLTELASI